MEISLLLLVGGIFWTHVRRIGNVLDGRAGVLLSLCFLARIDSLIYFAPLCAWLWWRTPRHEKLSSLAPLAGTILVYMVINQLLFGISMPVSGVAKSVLRITTFHAATWTSLFRGAQDQLMICMTCMISLWALAGGTRNDRVIIALSGAGVIVFFVATSLRSDWQIWQWYEFPFALHLTALAMLDIRVERTTYQRVVVAAAIVCSLLALLLIGFRNVRQATRETMMVTVAQRLHDFLRKEPNAIVAMGDRAGAVGELLPNRLIQLEGLVMDLHFLESMRRATTVVSLLAEYNVDYYVATNPWEDGSGCFVTREPAQSRGYSVQLNSRVCAPVVLDFKLADMRTVVFQMHPPRAE